MAHRRACVFPMSTAISTHSTGPLLAKSRRSAENPERSFVSRSSYHFPGEKLQSVDVYVFGFYSLENDELSGVFAVRAPAQVEALGLTWYDDELPQFSGAARFPWSALIDPAKIGGEVLR